MTRAHMASYEEAYAESLSVIALNPTALDVALSDDISLTATLADVSDFNSWQVPALKP